MVSLARCTTASEVIKTFIPITFVKDESSGVSKKSAINGALKKSIRQKNNPTPILKKNTVE